MTKTKMKLNSVKLLLCFCIVAGILTSPINSYVHDINEDLDSDMPSSFNAIDQPAKANGYDIYDEARDYDPFYNNYDINNNEKRSSVRYRRGCIPRNGACGLHWPKECCYNSSCRCNLWGTNCRCQRMGLFQKWG